MVSFGFASSYQLHIKDSMWNLIGVNGFHSNIKSSSPQDGFNSLTAAANAPINYNEAQRNTSSLGVQIINTDLGLNNLSLNYKYKDKNKSLPFYTMYVSSKKQGTGADIRIDFQSDYEGDYFYLWLNSAGYYFKVYFDPSKTEENPAFLDEYKYDEKDKINNILDLVDMNLSDNNLKQISQMNVYENQIGYNNIGGRQEPLPDDNISVYYWNDNSWQNFVKSNTNETNSLHTLVPNRGYWVFTSSPQKSPKGLILATNAKDEIKDLKSGWNLLSFNDSAIRYLSSGVFLPTSDLSQEITIKDSYKDATIKIPALNDAILFSAFVNNASFVGDKNGSFSWSIRAYPARTTTQNGVIIISDESFDISIKAKSLAAQELFDYAGDKSLSTRVDEFAMGLRLNDAFFNNDEISRTKDARLVFSVPRTNTRVLADLSADATKTAALEKLTTSLADTGTVYLLDLFLKNEYDTAFVVFKNKFYVKEDSITKLYEYTSTNNVDYKLEYFNATLDLRTSINLNFTLNAINDHFATTGVRAIRIDNNHFILQSKRDFNILELGKYEIFKLLELSSIKDLRTQGAVTQTYQAKDLANAELMDLSIQDLDNWSITRSALINSNTNIGRIYTPIFANLDTNEQWALDFPRQNPLALLNSNNKRVTSILSPVTRADKTILWRQADMTMDSNLWKQDETKFNLFRFYKKRGYWFYLQDYENTPIELLPQIESLAVKRSFHNIFPSNSSNEIGQVFNSRSFVIKVNARGLFNSNQAFPGEYGENVDLIVGGKIVPMIKDGQSNSYIARINDYKEPYLKESTDENKSVIIQVSNGLGKTARVLLDIDNLKPLPPSVEYSGTSLIVSSASNQQVAVFDGNLSDWGVNKKAFNDLELKANEPQTINPLESRYIQYDANKPFYDLRFIAYDKNMYSDMRRILYAPIFKNGHILHDEKGAAVDNRPVVFDSLGQNPRVFTINGNPSDNGVDLVVAQGFDNNISMAYKGIGEVVMASVGPFPNILYVRTAPTGGYTAKIAYVENYKNNVFYVYDHKLKKLFYGIFSADFTNTTLSPMQLTEINSPQSFYKPEI